MSKIEWILLFLIAAMIVFTIEDARAGEFCAGFADGYEQGYCYRNDYCGAPMPVMCPMPEVDNTYDEGYMQGLVQGLEDRDDNN